MTANYKHNTVSGGFRAAAIRVFAAIGLLVFATGLKAQQSTCGPADMKGAFATEPQGTLLIPLPPPLPSGPFVAVGLLQFDGVGAFSGTTSSSFGGAILPAFAAKGVYSVTPDCVVTVHETTLGIIFEGYFIKDKSQVVHFEPQAGTITTNVLHRLQLPNACDASNLMDNWVIQDTGAIAGTPNSLFAQNGRFTFDGHGTFHGNTNSSTGGTIVNHTVTGTYTMNSDCTFHAIFTDENSTASHLFGVLFSDGSQFYFDYQDAGTIIAGTGKQAVPANANGTTASVTPTTLTTSQASVVLDASGSQSGAGSLTYFYMVLPGGLKPALLQSPYNPKCTVDFVNGPGTYLVQLTVTDAKGNVATTGPISLTYMP